MRHKTHNVGCVIYPTLAFILGITATIYTRPRIPALLWWLFGNGKA